MTKGTPLKDIFIANLEEVKVIFVDMFWLSISHAIQN